MIQTSSYLSHFIGAFLLKFSKCCKIKYYFKAAISILGSWSWSEEVQICDGSQYIPISVAMLFSLPLITIICIGIVASYLLAWIWLDDWSSSRGVILLMRRKKATDRSDKRRQMETRNTVYKNSRFFFFQKL